MVDPKYVSKHFSCEEIDQRLLQGYYDDFVDKTGYSGDKDSFLIDLFSSINLPKDKKFSYLPANIGLEHFPEWSRRNRYLKGKVVFHNSLLFRANSTHTSGASFDDDASLWSTTTLSELVEEDLTSTITLDEMINFNPLADGGSSYLAGYLDKPSRYVVTKEVDGVPVNVGILEILSDSSQHVYTQVFTTHFTLDNSGSLDLGSHSDTKLVTYYRSYSVDSPLIDSGTWTKWEDISHYSDILESIAKNTKDIELLNANTGISEYPLFDEATAYAVGDVVLYEGLLKRFTSAHEAGAWDGTDVEEWSEKKGLTKLGTQVIYDVSANNGEAIFASLSELLSSENLSTLIPTAVRCGGMSIRFVQSSDNKYVQFRCMAQNFTTDVTQWQGVDEKPVAGSKNLLISNGVYNSLKDMSESNFSFFIEGNDNVIVRHKLAGLKQGRKYRLIIKNNDYTSDNTHPNNYIFQIYKYTGSTGTIVEGVYKGGTVNNYYDFEIDDSDYFGCFVRADIGQRVYMYVVDITEHANAVWFGGSTLPNIDTVAHTITFPSDGAFMVDNNVSLPINTNTPIDYYKSSTSSVVLVYNIMTRTISARSFNAPAIDGDVVFGGIKTLYGKPEQFLNATLPFDFTINGKSARDIAIDAKNKMTNGLFGFSFTGIGMGGDENGIIRYNFNTVKKRRKYRIVIVNNDYATSEIKTGYGIFQIYKYTGTEGTIVTNVAKGQSVNNYYDFVADDLTADYYGVFVRANIGVVVMMYMMDITDIDISLPLFFQNTGENKYYNGEDISLRHPITITTRNYTGGTSGYTQGLAYYNGHFVRCFNNLSKISIFNASTLVLESEFEPSLGLTVHCNTVSFGAKYDENDIFPLLYCPSEAASERKIYVIRINNTMDSVTLIQTISLPNVNEMPIYWPNGAIDIEGGHIVVSGYTDNHNAYGANVYPSSKIGVFIFNIPQIETQTILSSADIIDSFYIPAITTTQGFQVCNNRIYQIFGLPTQQLDPDIRLGVIDLGQKRIVNVINLTGYGITTEPEGLAIKDDSIFIDFINHFKEITF